MPLCPVHFFFSDPLRIVQMGELLHQVIVHCRVGWGELLEQHDAIGDLSDIKCVVDSFCLSEL
jgi:hypothetical protein